jgi:tetratricopeptide (TPR) repeat protein
MGVFTAAQGRSAEHSYNEVNGAYDRGDVSRAISLYERVVKLQPDFVPARTNLAVALAHDGRYQEAIVQYQEALNPKVVSSNLSSATMGA